MLSGLQVIRHLLLIPAAKSRPAAPADSAPSTSIPPSSRSPAPIPTSRTVIPSIDLTDDPVRTSHGASVERRLDRILDLLERQADRPRPRSSARSPRRRTRSRSLPRERRSRSPLRRRAVRQPAEPDHPPPPAVAPETPMNRIGLERRLRRELTATSGLHILHDFSGSSPDINGLTYEALNLSIEVCRRETKRDTTLWITNAELEYEHQQRDGIRATIRFRGYIQSSFVPVPEWMKRARWTRMTFLRKRESSDPWTLFELTAG